MGNSNSFGPMDVDVPSPRSELAVINSRSIRHDSTRNTLSQTECDQIYSFFSSGDESETDEVACSMPLCIEVPQCVLVSPKSVYEPFEPPYPLMSENDAVKLLLPIRCNNNDFFELQLNDFVVYCDTKIYQQEMRSLNCLETGSSSPPLYFNGVLSSRDQKIYVQRVPISALPIRNYGQESTGETKDKIWVQSKYNANRDVFYKLGEPAAEYKRFFEPFLWVADLAKHVVDYLSAMHTSRDPVTIHHFRNHFADWLLSIYSSSLNLSSLRRWMEKYPRQDYRSAVNSNIAFLYKECVGTLKDKRTKYHHLWAQILHYTYYIPYSLNPENSPTIVTDYIYGCFSHLPFGSKLKPVSFSAVSSRLQSELKGRRSFLRLPFISTQNETLQDGCIRPGDTISTIRDTAESGTAWTKENGKDDQYVDIWFALVQSVSVDSEGQRHFEVIWYYRPVDTLCALMRYPWTNELFLSDHCSCTELVKIREDEVVGVHQVDFGGMPDTTEEFFCRQAYLVDEKIWVTLRETHFSCSHNSCSLADQETRYGPGDTVLVHITKNSQICEPCEIFDTRSGSDRALFTFRKLLRRSMADPAGSNARQNEVVYSKDLVQIAASRIVSRCHVRWFHVTEQVPCPYDRDGTGAFFFLTHQKELANGCAVFVPLQQAPPSLNQGYDPYERSLPKLRGLDLFCGGGNFGRGLAEAGSVEMRWANDIDSTALHAYMANTDVPEQVAPFLGSIDEFQIRAIQGHFADNIPRIGEVDFISGGSPCPGFSSLTNDKTTDAQRKNQSLVAAFASCVDVYRPKYGVLENVVGIIKKHDGRDEDVFSQLMCALVGMGFQARLFLLDALSCGSPQTRSRVFIMFAAPGFILPERPLQTHSHQLGVKNLSLGKLSTGEFMAKREMAMATPFQYTSASQATKDLPKVYDGKPDICVPYPDHRVVSCENTNTMRTRVRLIPKFPFGMNFAKAWYGNCNGEVRAAG